MKKLIVLLLSVLLCMNMAACSKNEPENTGEKDPETAGGEENVPGERSEEEILAEDYDAWNFDEVVIYTPKELQVKKTELENYEFSLQGDDILIFIAHISKQELSDLGYQEDDLIATLFEDQETQTFENGIINYFYYNSVNETEYYYGYGLMITDENYWDLHMAVMAECLWLPR